MRLSLVFGGLVILFLAGFWFSSQAIAVVKTTKESPKPYIVATTGHIADIVQNIAGERVHVDSLMGPGTDPHLYRPTRLDILKLKKADIVFYNGLHLEGQMVELLETLQNEKPSVAMSTSLHADGIIDGADGVHDPHIWMDTKNWARATDVVLKTLSVHTPDNHAFFEERAKHYKDRLTVLDSFIHKAVSTLPEAQRTLITAHDAFGYLGDAYGLEVIGIQGLSTASEAGLQKISSLVERLVAEAIPAIFIETSVSDQNIKALIAGAKASGHNVQIGGALYSDALGAAGTYQGTYIGMMEHNVRTIVDALGGKAPELGLSNKIAEL